MASGPAGWYPGRCKDCALEALAGKARCKECAAEHSAREKARRDERRRRRQCWVCGKPVVKDESGKWLASCEAHRGTAWRTG